MQLYSAKIQLNGSRDNEVRKDGLSAAEIHILRHLHKGAEHVTEIKPYDAKGTDHAGRRIETERAYLMSAYKPATVMAVFPNEFAELPRMLGVELPADEPVKGPQPEIDITQVKRPKQASPALS